MTHINAAYAQAANEYRIAGPFTSLNFGLVEIDWEKKPAPLITLKVIGEDGTTGFSHPVRQGELRGGKVAGAQAMVTCPGPRPQVCTQDYRPVCAQLRDGSFKTYSNGCTACTDPAVTAYREGACE
jgi:hypothetical protein